MDQSFGSMMRHAICPVICKLKCNSDTFHSTPLRHLISNLMLALRFNQPILTRQHLILLCMPTLLAPRNFIRDGFLSLNLSTLGLA